MDQFDSRIIQALLTHEATIHELSKLLSKRDSAIRYRLMRLAEEGLVRKRSNGDKGIYFVPLDDITYGKARIIVTTRTGPVTAELGPVLVTDRDGLRQVIVLT